MPPGNDLNPMDELTESEVAEVTSHEAIRRMIVGPVNELQHRVAVIEQEVLQRYQQAQALAILYRKQPNEMVSRADMFTRESDALRFALSSFNELRAYQVPIS